MANEHKEWGAGVFSLLSWFRQENVKKAKVMVVGAGALGNEVLKNLALFGVGNIFIVDFDTIEYSNLTRSILFRESDADKGLYKAEVAARRIREINRNINVQYIVGNLSSDVGLGVYKQMDVVIGCLDSRLARLQLNRQCMRAGVPWVDGGIEDLNGVVKVFKRGVNCYECGLSDTAKHNLFQKMSCAGVAKRNEDAGRIPTTPVIASIIGAIQTQEAMKLLHPEELYKGNLASLCGQWFHYEGMHNNVRVYKSSAYNSDCPSHEYWKPVFKIPQLSADITVEACIALLKDLLNVESVEINLRNDRFVDKIVTRNDNQCFRPMLPESKIPDYIDSDPLLYRRLKMDLNQNTYENIDEEFPYPHLTLREIGIPYSDILQITTESGYFYVELTKDENRYPFV